MVDVPCQVSTAVVSSSYTKPSPSVIPYLQSSTLLFPRSPPISTICTPEAEMKSPECHHLTLCNKLISSLSDCIPTVQSFRGRWSVIATKISRLRSSISDLEEYPDHPLSIDLLKSLAGTLSATLTLALHFSSSEPPAGKLQTQSEMSIANAALDQHLADVDVLLKSRVLLLQRYNNNDGKENLSNVNPAVETKKVSSKQKIVQDECQTLVTRLQLGSNDHRNAAMDTLLDLLRLDEKNVLIAVAQGVVPALIHVLESCSGIDEMKEKTVAAIARISAVESCRRVLIGEGLLLLNHLSRVLESGSGVAKEKACVALQNLTLTRENSMAVGSRRGVSSLLQICRLGTATAQSAAIGVLRNLVAVDEIRLRFVEENGVKVLSRVCNSGTASAQENAIVCARNLVASNDSDLKSLIFHQFGIDTILNYWDYTNRNIDPAIGLLRQLASGDPSIADTLVSSDLIPRLLSSITNPSSSTRTEAVRALYQLPKTSKARNALSQSDCVPLLIRMLEAKGAEEKDAVVKALSSLTVYTENSTILKKEKRGIENLVLLLNPLVSDVAKKHPVSILSSVSGSASCRKRMVDAGARGFLRRLVSDGNVEGARKLLESLEKGGNGGGGVWGCCVQ